MKRFIKISVLLSPLLATPLLTSCWFSYERHNIASTFYNSFDMLVTLGISPDIQSKTSLTEENSKNRLNYVPYMEKYIEPSKINFTLAKFNYSEPIILEMSKLEIDTLVLNEWDRVNEKKYLEGGKAARYIAYTSMADSINSKYNNDNIYYKSSKYKHDMSVNSWHTYKEGTFSYISALKMLATDLDKRYVSNDALGNKLYLDRANEVEKHYVDRVNALRKIIQDHPLFKGKNIGILSGQNSGGGGSESLEGNKIKYIYDPFIYPYIYGGEDIGMGFDFPKPDTAIATQVTWADDGGSLATIGTGTGSGDISTYFQNKFDFIIYMASPYEIKNVESLTEKMTSLNITKFLKNNTNEPSNKLTNSDRVVAVDYLDWYPSTWGPLGTEHVMNQFVGILNWFVDKANTYQETGSPFTKITEDINIKVLKTFSKESLIQKPRKK